MKYSLDFLQAMPKTDLHVHLDGSLRVATLIDLAKEHNIKLPSYTVDGLNELVFKENYASLDEYLQGFAYTCAVMQTPEALERIAYEFAWDNWDDGVRYVECRFAPQLLINPNQNMEQVIGAIDRGFKKAKAEINQNLAEDEPEFEYGLIICAMRFFTADSSYYYKQFCSVHKYSSSEKTVESASIELARAVVKLKETTDFQIVGFDVAGSEYGHPAIHHKKAYSIIHKNFIHKTIHAGEAYGCESIFQAITELHAERIGHGLFMFDSNMIFSEKIQNKDKYIHDLADYIANRRITIEVCLTSNLQTTPSLKSLKEHSFGKMLDRKLSVSLCTDNRLVSHTSVTNEYELAVNNFEISPKELYEIVMYGFKRAFFARDYATKRKYVRKVIEYYRKLEREYNK